MFVQHVQEAAGEASGSLEFGLNLTPEAGILVAATLAGAWTLNKVSNRLVDRAVEERGGDKHAAFTAKKVTAYVSYTLGLVVILGILGVNPSALASVLGLIGLGVSFALRDVISNFISGLMILVNKPFEIGDQIRVDGYEGTIKDIRIRASDIKTFDGRKVIVPNSTLYNDIVVNDTAYAQRRFNVVVGVGYDDDIKEASDLAEEALEETDGVLSVPSPQVLVDELGGSSVNLKLRGWTKPERADQLRAASKLTENIKHKYDDAGIDIPYPIRTINLNKEN